MSKFRHLEYQNALFARMGDIAPHVRLAFSAAIAERLLAGAEVSLMRWQLEAWASLRQALDEVWSHLEGKVLTHLLGQEIYEECSRQLPNSQDEIDEFEAITGPGAFEAITAVIYTLDALLKPDLHDAVRVSSQAYEALRSYLIPSLFPDAQSGSYAMHDAVFESEPIQTEIAMEERQLALLTECAGDDQEFAAALLEVMTESKENPLKLPEKWDLR